MITAFLCDENDDGCQFALLLHIEGDAGRSRKRHRVFRFIIATRKFGLRITAYIDRLIVPEILRR
jgi:hypothetical protein